MDIDQELADLRQKLVHANMLVASQHQLIAAQRGVIKQRDEQLAAPSLAEAIATVTAAGWTRLSDDRVWSRSWLQVIACHGSVTVSARHEPKLFGIFVAYLSESTGIQISTNTLRAFAVISEVTNT